MSRRRMIPPDLYFCAIITIPYPPKRLQKPPQPKPHLAPPPLPFLPTSTQPIYTTHRPYLHTIHYPTHPPPTPHIPNYTCKRAVLQGVEGMKRWSAYVPPHAPTINTTPINLHHPNALRPLTCHISLIDIDFTN